MAYAPTTDPSRSLTLAALLAMKLRCANSAARFTYCRPVSFASLTLALSSFFWIFATSA
jgi:hypothetical protein